MNSSIAISGLPGSGSTTVARLLAKRLNLKYFSAGQLWKDIAEGHLESQVYYDDFLRLAKSHKLDIPFLESSKAQSALNLWKTDLGKNPKFHQVLESLQKILAEKTPIVIDGKLSVHMLNAHFKIWLTGSLEARAQRTAQRDHISKEEAERLLEEREKLHRKEWLRIYNFDYLAQEKEADIVIDSTDKSSEEIVDIILSKLSKK